MPIGNLSANFINDTTTSAIVNGLFYNVGGSWFTTIMLIVLFVILIALVMKVPLEATIVVVLPLLIVSASYVPDIMSVLGVVLIYIGILIGSNWFFK